MSDSEVAKALQDLTKAVQALTLVSGAASSSHLPEPPTEWELIGGEASRSEKPLDLPEAVLHLVKSRLSAKEPGAEERARRAFEAGIRAAAAIASGDRYLCEPPLADHAIGHWVVLRCGDRSPFRTQTKTDYKLLTQGSKDLVAEAFPSLCEVQVFCLGAQCEVPELQKWKKK